MGSNRITPCWPTLITTTITVMGATCATIGFLLNNWMAPRDAIVNNKIASIQSNIKNIVKKNEEIEDCILCHKAEDVIIIEKINKSVDKYRDAAEHRDKESKELMTEIKVTMAGVKVTMEYIKETLKELKQDKNSNKSEGW